jgi:guanylate kinase
MAEKVRVWFDAEGDFLEVRFSDKAAFMRETKNDAVMERVNEQGNILGFSIMQVSRLSKGKPLIADLVSA